MKHIRNEYTLEEWKKWYQDNDKHFGGWIDDKDILFYKKAIEEIGNEKVVIHTYPNYTDQSALLKCGDSAPITEIFAMVRKLKTMDYKYLSTFPDFDKLTKNLLPFHLEAIEDKIAEYKETDSDTYNKKYPNFLPYAVLWLEGRLSTERLIDCYQKI